MQNAVSIVQPLNISMILGNGTMETAFLRAHGTGELCSVTNTDNMANDKFDKKGVAKSLYLDGNYTQEEIAAKVGSTRQTVSRWVRDGGWEELKASLTITPAQIISRLQRQIVEINNNIDAREAGKRFATPAEADALAKLAGAVKKLESEVGVADTISVGMRFLSWLRPLDAGKAVEFSDLFDAFIKNQLSRKR